MKKETLTKIATWVGIAIPLVGILEWATIAGAKYILKDEIQQIEHLMKFAKDAEENIIPLGQRNDEEMDIRIHMLEEKHGRGWSVGLRWNKIDKKMEYRGEDGIPRDAHQYPSTGAWYYIYEGYDKYVYE